MYSNNFKRLVEISNGQFIGTGNPESKIVVVGKEVATDDSNLFERANLINYHANSEIWRKNVKTGMNQEDVKDWNFDSYLKSPETENNPLFAFKGTIVKNSSDTWKKYQKLHDVIFTGKFNKNTDRSLNFQRDFFITEMNDSPSKKTLEANKDSIVNRKEEFFKTEYFRNVPVVVLACGDYITNNSELREIDEIFGVRYDGDETGRFIYSNSNWFFTHHSPDKKRLVIHTRQLSMAVKDELINGMGEVIRKHLDSL